MQQIAAAKGGNSVALRRMRSTVNTNMPDKTLSL
jgi:hypothetical protein